MWNRRDFLRMGALGSATLIPKACNSIEQVAAASAAVADRAPDEVAQDEFYWREIQEAFTLDRTLTNLNNGNTCPSPRVVHEAVKRYMDMANMLPVQYNGMIGRNVSTVRRRMAAEFGCDVSELALTRNASESMQIAQNGIDMNPGDEVVTTEQDYPRMLTTWDQRMRRDKIKVTRIQFPVPTTQDDLYQRLEKAITPQTKVLHFCHITNLTGQLFPVQRLARLARSRGILTMVDGAHALAHFPFKLRDLECDYYGVSLHKWLLAPIGNGLLYVRKENIAKTWPLQAVPDRQANDISKFEQIGTHPEALRAAVAEALAFHQAIGIERKAARLRYLTLRWANAIKSHPKVKILSNLDAGQTWGVAMVGIEGIDPRALSQHMMDRYRIVVNAVVGGTPPQQVFDYSGLRVTPNVYTTLEEVDTFAQAMLDVAKNGLPPAPAGRGGGGRGRGGV
ncbi:MAG TPA: aminotransferase class V-fold PLP-dependent enzyme [Vicinamibacterales bacterium]|nr:aminotransferase class V-fold PLP-dependent enzyme [Vicinamibacterales bacterium]